MMPPVIVMALTLGIGSVEEMLENVYGSVMARRVKCGIAGATMMVLRDAVECMVPRRARKLSESAPPAGAGVSIPLQAKLPTTAMVDCMTESFVIGAPD